MIDFENSKYTIKYGEIGNDSYHSSFDEDDDRFDASGEMYKILVYGTLRKGYGNHSLLANSEFVKEVTVPGYKMVSNGGFPYSYKVEDMSKTIKGEIYLVDGHTLSRLDGLEGVSSNHYSRVPVDRPGFEGVELYVPHESTSTEYCAPVPSGDFKDDIDVYSGYPGWGY